MKKKIKAIIFDYGGVISENQDPGAFQKMCRIVQIPKDIFMLKYRKFRIDYDSNIISAEEFWKRMLEKANSPLSSETVKRLVKLDVESWTVINKKMLQFIAGLCTKTVKKAMVSNMTLETLQYMQEHFTWLNEFDHLVFSCELNSSKPASLIYYRCLELLDLKPDDCLFIDDSLENIKGAQRVGLNTIQFRNYEQFRQEMDRTYKLI